MTAENGSFGGAPARPDAAEGPSTSLVPPKALSGATSQSADSLLEGAAEALTRKAITMALSGHAPSLRFCLDRLATLRNGRSSAFVFPAIDSPGDLPGATLALLRAVAAGELTPVEAAALAKLVDAHIRAIETADFHTRLCRLEGGQDP